MENSCKLNINKKWERLVFPLLNNIYSYIVIKIFGINMIFMFTHKV